MMDRGSLARALMILALSATLFSCSGGGGSDRDNDDTNNGSGDGNVVAGILFPGDPAALARDAIVDFDSGDRTSESDISVDSNGVEIDRTNLEVALVDSATTGAVNALLESIGARIVNMVEGVKIIVIGIPDPGDLAALAGVVATLEASPLVDWVLLADMSGTDALPANINPATTDSTRIDHHLAVLAPAAWNVSNALQYPAAGAPLMLLSDYFGNGAPDSDFDLNVLDPTDFFTRATTPGTHGYHVLGIISGRHEMNPLATSARQQVTGMYPGTLDLRAVDRKQFNRPQSENELIKIIRRSGRRVVLNTSLHSGCARPPQQGCVMPRAYSWIRKLRGDIAFDAGQKSVWEESFLLHVTSAGNFKTRDSLGNVLNPPDDRDGTLNSQYSAAALVGGLSTSQGTPVPNVSNTLVVENRVNSAAPFIPGCLAGSSKTSGVISGIGSAVWSFTDWASTSANRTGTSMSTPQVAALGAYIWALKPALKPDEIADILFDNAVTFGADSGCTQTPGAVIDAYASVLAIDDAKAINPLFANPMDAPARLALLDVVSDGGASGANRRFDEHDLAGFVGAFYAANSANQDFSRFDLNGDGFTGGTVRTGWFNLDIDAQQSFDPIMQEIEGVAIDFDESAVTDWEILCYYAYSPMFTGLDSARAQLLGSICSGAEKILFVSPRDGGFLHVYSMDLNGANQTQLTTGMAFNAFPLPSPDATKVMFIDRDDIYSMNADGTNIVNLTGSQDLEAGSATWSPDGSRISYSANSTDAEDIYVMNANGSGPANLTNNPDFDDDDPAWSPDGSKILFESERDGNWEIYVMNADGSGQTNLSQNAASDLSPGWSPDGSKILFRSNRDGNREVYVMNADGTAQTNLSNNPADDLATFIPGAAWSPDGSKIVFSSDRGVTGAVYIMNADGSGQSKISGAGLARFPVWSTSGNKVIYECFPDGNADICSVDPDGSNPANLTQNSAPDWLFIDS